MTSENNLTRKDLYSSFSIQSTSHTLLWHFKYTIQLLTVANSIPMVLESTGSTQLQRQTR